ncbi:MAG: family N-acetyltransferase [Ilumatobacteraceae bacterium]|nr:family N-acetyltransferase [Ilumatobacteraceae bacterium]
MPVWAGVLPMRLVPGEPEADGGPAPLPSYLSTMATALRLRAPRLEDEASALRAHAELAEVDFTFLLGWDGGPWSEYVDRCRARSRGVGVDPGMVASTFLLAELGGEVVGRASVRHELNETLRREGGHIGVGVRPVWRGRGVGTEILRQSLLVARSVGIERVLVTCDDDNVASAAMIERCGGILDSVVQSAAGPAPVRRYWID